MTSSISKKIGIVLKRIRKSAKMNQDEFAYILDISPRYYQDIELGKRNLSASTIDKFRDRLPSVFDGEDVIDHWMNKIGLNSSLLISSDKLDREKITTQLTSFDEVNIPIQVIDVLGNFLYMNFYNYVLYETNIETLVNKAQTCDYVGSEKEKEYLKSYLKFVVDHRPPTKPYLCPVASSDGVIIDTTVQWRYILNKKNTVLGFICFCQVNI